MKQSIIEKKSRESNIELLRILAIIMIILHHITIHCVNVQLGDKSLHKVGELFNNFTFYKKLLLSQTFMPIGKIGNIIFILITGYFLIDRPINILKQFKKLISQLLFIVPILVIASYIYFKFKSPSFTGLINFYLFNSDYWFIGFYMGIILVAHLFLNNFLHKLDKKQYSIFLIVMFSIISIDYLRNTIAGISSNLVTLFAGVFIYSFGGFIKIYNPFKNIRTIHFISIIILSFIAIWISFYINTINNINNAKAHNSIEFYQSLNALGEYSIFCILIATGLFELFKRIKIPNNKVINYVASSTFMIYLVHDNNFIRKVWNSKDWINIYYYNLPKFIILHLKWIAIIVLSGIVVYSLYLLFLKILKTDFIKKMLFVKSIEQHNQ